MSAQHEGASVCPADAQLVFGTAEPVAPALPLRAGALHASLRGTRLGPLTYRGHEVWHGVDFLYRDADWGTPQPHVQALEHSESAAGFRVRLRGRIAAASEIAFEIHIEADERGLRYEATASVREDLATNRTGVVLMHPLAACGRRLQVEHTDGRLAASTFPTLVAPWPPFTLVRAIRHEYAGGAWACSRFHGDDFELEDQRNNADASFKTYSRSNLMPRPYMLRAGAILRQAVELRIESGPASPRLPPAAPVRARVGAVGGTLPSIGTAIALADLHAPQHVRSALRELAPPHLHLSLQAGAPPEAEALARLRGDAPQAQLHLELTGLDAREAPAQLAALAQPLAAAAVVPRAIAVFPSTPPVLEAARRAFPQSRIGGGTPFFFTQLNRIEDLGACDFLCFATAAVVHGADDEEIMAGLQSLPAMLATLRTRHGGVPVHVGPSSIGARRSPLGAQPAADGTQRLALARRDPRTRGRYGAAWALGYAARFIEAGAQALTLFDLAGDAALVTDEGRVPAFELLRRLGRPAQWRRVEVSAPGAVAVIALQHAGRSETLVANLRGCPLDFELADGGRTRRITLAPYGLSFV